MARKIVFQSKDGTEYCYPKTSAELVEGLTDTIKEALKDYISVDDLTAELEKATKNFLTTTEAASNYATKDDLSLRIKYSDLDNFVKYGVFKVNGEPVLDSEVILEVGKVYELSGYLDGHINVYSSTGGDKTNYDSSTDYNAADTQIILNGVYINSDRSQGIYCNQKKKKLVITYRGDNTIVANSSTGSSSYTDADSVIEVDNSLYLIGDHNATLRVESNYDGVHAIKAQELFLQGDGKVTCKAIHDAFHGTNILRCDGGSYEVEYAKDAFGTGNGGYLYVLKGNYNIIYCYENGFDAKGKGCICGPKTNVQFTVCGDGLIGNKMYILDDVPSIKGYYGNITSKADYYGEGHVYTCANSSAEEEEVLASTTEVTLGSDGYYTVNSKEAWITGYISHPVKMAVTSCDLYFKNACIEVSSDDGALIYTLGSKKIACRGVEDTLNTIVNNGNGDAI